MSPSNPPYDSAKLGTLKAKGQWNVHKKAVNAISFSPDGKLLASADDEGLLVVQETATDTCIRMYQAAKPILKVAWNPAHTSVLYAGCTNGEIVKLRIDKRGEKHDDIAIETVGGWIHAIAVSKMGEFIAVACGNRVVVARQESLQQPWSHTSLLPIPKIEDGQHPLIREVHIINDIILVSFFFPDHGIVAYSTEKPHKAMWRLPKIDGGNLVAGSAVSPSGKRLVVANMTNGVDVYDLEARTFVENIVYDIGGYRYVDVAFVDDQTVIVGNPLGAIIAVTLERVSERVYTIGLLQQRDPVQTVACAIIGGQLRIVAGSTEILEPAKLLVVTEDEDLKEEKKKRTMKRKCGCCLIQSAVGITAMAICFAFALSTELAMGPGSDLDGNGFPLVVTTDRVPLVPVERSSDSIHAELPNTVTTNTETKTRPVFRIMDTLKPVVPGTPVKSNIKSVSMINPITKPTTLIGPSVQPVIHEEHTSFTTPGPVTMASVQDIITTITKTQTTTVLHPVTVTMTVAGDIPATTHTNTFCNVYDDVG